MTVGLSLLLLLLTLAGAEAAEATDALVVLGAEALASGGAAALTDVGVIEIVT